ncbi:MAG: glycine cleavage system aminomethyltransferase GcvT [Acidimicrobiales bacterium]
MTELRRTPLHALHSELGGRLVDFAGWELPIQYDGVIAEHTWCRESAGLFDVSHMGVVELHGDDRAVALERLTPAGITTLEPGKIRYALFTLGNGGVLDDLMVTNAGTHLSLVVNAARRDVDLPHLRQWLPDLRVVERDDLALLALQGPKAVDALSRLAPAVSELYFLEATTITIDDVAIGVSRSGYTGEDGFELTIANSDVEQIARLLLAQPEVKPAGLGARDTLRLEASLCLYGHELTENTSPVEADLKWTIPKRRREARDFPGAHIIMDQYENGPERIRVGIAPEGKRPVRDGAELRTPGGQHSGVVCSGGYGPTVERPIAMAYVATEHSAVGTELVADVRGADVSVVVCDLPFAPHRYHRQASQS